MNSTKDGKRQDYVLTIVQHTYCNDCYKLKNKVIEVYNASGISRGDDSMHWRMEILSPSLDASRRPDDFPQGFDTLDVPGLKLEADGKVVFAVQEPFIVEQLLARLKWMLINHQSNEQIASQLTELIARPEVLLSARGASPSALRV